jgi:hypothetical protein
MQGLTRRGALGLGAASLSVFLAATAHAAREGANDEGPCDSRSGT